MRAVLNQDILMTSSLCSTFTQAFGRSISVPMMRNQPASEVSSEQDQVSSSTEKEVLRRKKPSLLSMARRYLGGKPVAVA